MFSHPDRPDGPRRSNGMTPERSACPASSGFPSVGVGCRSGQRVRLSRFSRLELELRARASGSYRPSLTSATADFILSESDITDLDADVVKASPTMVETISTRIYLPKMRELSIPRAPGMSGIRTIVI